MDAITRDELYDATANLPKTWFADGDKKALSDLLIKVDKRRQHLPRLLAHQWQSIQSRWLSSSSRKDSPHIQFVPALVH